LAFAAERHDRWADERKVSVGREDWYRRKTWTAADQDAFWTRFNRSRSAASKTQYLLIQAGSLLSVGDPDLVPPALALVDRVLGEHADEVFLSNAHYTRGQCLVALRRFDEALPSYRLSFEARRSHRGVQTLAYLDFAWLVLEMERADLYDEVLQVLDEFSAAGELFPMNAYRNAAARALLWAAKDDTNRAATYAREAIAASSKSESPFRHHRHFGVVNEIDQTLHARLFALAAAQR
jgi:tetratricopeptide (TPR) repeat protein